MIQRLIEFLEREAGYIVVCLGLVLLSVILLDQQQRPSAAHDLLTFGTGVLAASMGTRKNPPPAI